MRKPVFALLMLVVMVLPATAQLPVFTDAYAANVSTNQFSNTYANFWSINNTTAHTGASCIQVAVGGNGALYTGGTIYSSDALNLSSYNAVTFYIKADRTAVLNQVGIGNSPSGATYKAYVSNINLTTSWQKIIIPIPDASKLTSEKGLLYFSETQDDGGLGAYNFYIDDIQYETLSNGDAIGATTLLSFPNETSTIEFVGMTYNSSGNTVNWNVGITNAGNPNQVSANFTINRTYLSNTASVAGVASISGNSNGNAVITAVGGGTTVLTSKLGSIPFTSGGQYTVTVTNGVGAAPVPLTPSGNVKNFYSNTFSNPANVTNWSSNTGRSTASEVVVSGNNTRKFVYTSASNPNYSQTLFTAMDVSAYNFIHIDMYTPNTTTFRIKLVQAGVNSAEVTLAAPVTGKWLSYDVPLSSFSNATFTAANLASIDQMLFVASAGSTVYLDNIYFTTTASYYLKAGGSIDDIGNWGQNSDGSFLAGTGNNSLANFNGDNINYYIVNNTTPSLATDITIYGSNARMVLGNGVTSTSLLLSDYSFNGTMDLANKATLTIQGSSTPAFGTLSTGSTVVLAGSAAQSIPAASYHHLTINNESGCSLAGAATVNGTFTLQAGSLNTVGNNFSLGASANAILAAGTAFNINGGTSNFNGRPVTFKATSSGAARLGQVAGTLVGATDVTIEKYIAAGNRAYRLLTPIVTTTGTIKDNWQEAVNNTSTSFSLNQNPVPGYGTHITGSTTGAHGFDATITGSSSLKQYDVATQKWTDVSNTDINNLIAGNGYLLFIRGNRAYDLNTVSATNTATTLRTTGQLLTGTIITNSNGSGTAGMPALTSAADGFSLVGNPYASPVSWTSVHGASTDITGYYYIWDPNIGTRGAYVACSVDGTKSNPSSYITTDIAAGQGFFVQNNPTISSGPSVVFHESDKTDGSTFSSTAVVPVNGGNVRASFNGTGIKGIHPRLLYSANDIQQIKTNVQTDALLKGNYDEIISKADAILPTALLTYALDGAGLRIPSIHTISNEQIPYLVLAYKFTNDTKYALRAWQQLDLMCSYPDWGANRHFLDAGIAAKGVAIAYDGLYDYLDSTKRARLWNAVKTFVLEPGKTQIETNTGPFKWYLTNDNWNGICHGGMIMASLAGYEQDSTFNSDVISLCANGMLKYMQSLEPDGASEEGMSYWSYGLSNTFLAYESMKRCLSSTFGLADQPGFSKTGWFPYLVSGPAGTASVGDDYTYNGKTNRMLSFFWFSRYFNDANLAKAHYDACMTVNASKSAKMNGWSDLLFYKKDLVAAGSSAAYPLNNYIRGLEYMYVQEATNNDNALYIGMHGGDNNASHGHLDAGSFYLQALGENFAVGNLGKEDPYPADYFTTTNPTYNAAPTTSATTPGRYYYYRVKTESKNCLVFNPDARPEQNPAGVATLSSSGADATGGYYVVDLASCYSRDVSVYKRGIKLNRTTGVITVQDEFTPKSSSTLYWLMQSPATDGLVISSDGKTATMTKNGKTFYAVIKSPSNAVFTKVDRSTSSVNYLTETMPIFGSIMNGKNGLNPYYGKLQIKLTGVSGATTIRVDFVKSTGAAMPPVTGLQAWTTSN